MIIFKNSDIGEEIKKIRIEPEEFPVPVEDPVEVPELEPVPA